MDSELLRIVCALAAVVLPLALAWFIVGWQAGRGKRHKTRVDARSRPGHPER